MNLKLYTLSPLRRSPSGQANPPSAGNTLDRLSTLFFYLAILIFLIGFNFTDSPPPSGWYQQWFPNMNGRPISDITFIDSLNGWAVTPYIANDTAYIIKTTNAGDNWNIVFRQPTNTVGGFSRVQFLNLNTGFACGNFLWKTTNSGLNWFNINAPYVVSDMSALNEDTIWVVGCNGFYDAVMRTTNGGASWQEQLTWGSLQNTNIYMYNSRIGFACLYFPASMWKTTNSGLNWFNITNKTFSYMYFIDSLNGWKATGIMEKTTDGGYNWITQVMPSGGYIFSNQVLQFTSINKDTLWGVGGYMQYEYPPLKLRGMIYKTTNGGLNWGFQLPDTHTVTCTIYGYINFVNKNIGWVYNGYTGAHTLTGGDTVNYYGIQKINNTIPKEFSLKQNYPNPFNPRTVIPYSLKSAGYVRIIAYDILGREVQRLVDQKQSAGEYEVDFMGKFCSSGVYFYRMTVDGKVIDTKKMLMLK